MRNFKILIVSPLYFLFLLIVILTSCFGQNKSTFSEKRGTESAVTPKTDSQISEYIRHIFQDKNGNFWFGTNNYGAVHFNGDSLSYFSVEQGFEGRQITGITAYSETSDPLPTLY